uniref:ATP synthase complex subunit 8 n=1 Tax=Meru phyllisae TaxID=535381 RepID=S4SWW4_9COLE|nr:ATP synthase F0 subunit 8 [Meru phyllisae]
MPQMAPMNWLILMMFFTSIFLIMNFLNYYLFLKTPNKNFFKNKNSNLLNWKW